MGTRTHTVTLPGPPVRAARAETPIVPCGGFELCRGARLGDYQLLAPVGRGGMAHVWAAVRSGDYGFQRLFAIKVMREEIAGDPSFRRMFLEEAKLAARIRHTHVVEVLDLGEQAGTVYHVMPLIEGDSLARLVRAHQEREPGAKVPRSVAVRIVVDALRGLHSVHEITGEGGAPLGVVHRDVSPQNILVGIDGVSKIADFGVAKAQGVLGEETEGGAPRGKLAYMSPEQILRTNLDRRSDLFATGVVLWELLTGKALAPTAARTVLTSQGVDDPRTRDASIPASLAEITLRALEADRDHRFASADEMADALEAASREHGLSTKEVASWVTPLTTSTLARRRDDVAEAAATVGLSVSATGLRVPSKAPEPPRMRRAWRALPVLGLVLVTALAATGYSRWVVVPPAPPPALPVAPISVDDGPLHATATEPVPKDDGARGAPGSPVAGASPPPATRGSAPLVKARRSREPAPVRPKFENPYAR